ncbi:MAG: hypothetical protein AAF639_34350 [Chloroflexota bacterium]
MDNKEEIKHLQNLLKQHKKNRRTLESDIASYGLGEVPLHLTQKIEYEKSKIEQIKEKLQRLEDQGRINIAFVTAAMTLEEARDAHKLHCQMLNDSSPLSHKAFHAFHKHAYGVKPYADVNEAVWLSSYGDKRADWRPDSGSEQTIGMYIEELIRRHNDNCKRNDNSPIKYRFHSDEFFLKGTQGQQDCWEELYEDIEEGIVHQCIFIVDLLSLVNDKILDALHDCGFLGRPKKEIILLILSPVKLHTAEVNQLLKKIMQEKHSMYIVSQRADDIYDRMCEFLSSDLNTFQGWLHARIQDITGPGPFQRKAQSDSIACFAEKMSRPRTGRESPARWMS